MNLAVAGLQASFVHGLDMAPSATGVPGQIRISDEPDVAVAIAMRCEVRSNAPCTSSEYTQSPFDGSHGGAANTLQPAPRDDRELKAVIALMLRPATCPKLLKMERETGFEPATSSLGSRAIVHRTEWQSADTRVPDLLRSPAERAANAFNRAVTRNDRILPCPLLEWHNSVTT